MPVTVKNNQSLFDIAIQHCGSAEAAFAIAVLNAKSITDDLVAGEVLQLPAVANRAVAEYYTNNKLQPATGITGDLLGSVWDNTFDDTFGTGEAIFDYTFDTSFE